MCSSAFLFEPQAEAKIGPANVWEVEFHEWSLSEQCVPVPFGRVYAAMDQRDAESGWMIGKRVRLRWPGHFADVRVVAMLPVELPERPEPCVLLEAVDVAFGWN